jgi:hypothetical protein
VCSALRSLLLADRVLLVLQHTHCASPPRGNVGKARIHRKPLETCLSLGIELRRDLLPSLGNALTLNCGIRWDRRRDALTAGDLRHQQHGQREASPHHVRRVSTKRRSCAMYALDCISLRRDTVRGNSCTIGPSV